MLNDGMFTSVNSEFETPKWLFNELNKEFNFIVDVCATRENSLCPYFIEDALVENICWSLLAIDASKVSDFELSFLDTSTGSYFMNPPYGLGIIKFVERAWKESINHPVVCLLPARTDTKWWSIFWNRENHKPKEGCEVRFLEGRLKFNYKQKPVLSKKGIEQTAPFPSAIVIMDRRHINPEEL